MATTRAKTSLKIQNIVATTSLGKDVPLTKLAKTIANTEYNPEQFPGLVLRIKQPKSAVLVFSSGNLVCTGTKSISQVKLGDAYNRTRLTPTVKRIFERLLAWRR